MFSWKCSEYKTIYRNGRIHVVDEKIIKFTEHNDRVPNAPKIKAKKVISTLKENALQTTLGTRSGFGNAVVQDDQTCILIIRETLHLRSNVYD